MLESFKDNWGLRFLHSFHFGVVSPFQRSGVLFPKVWCPLSKGLVSPFQKHGVLFPKACESKHCRTLNAERRQCTLAKDGWNSQMTKYLTVNYSEKELSYYALGALLPVFYCSVCQCAPASPYHSHFTLPAPYLAVCNQKPTLHRSAHCKNQLFPLRAVCIAVYYPRD